jgi:hypothetical protein
LITELVLASVVLLVALFWSVYCWEDKPVRWLSLAWALALVWVIQSQVQARYWFRLEQAWQTAYYRDIGTAGHKSQQLSQLFRYRRSTESVCDDAYSGVSQLDHLTVPYRYRNDSLHAAFEESNRALGREISEAPSACEAIIPRLNLVHSGLGSEVLGPRFRSQPAITTDLLYNFNTEAGPTPYDWCCP